LNLTYGTNTPLTIPGCQLWLDAADSSTITGTTSVTAWADKSGMNYTMTNNQGTCSVSAASLNGLNTIYVPSGANLKLANFLFHTKFTTFIVGKADTGKLLIGGRFGTNNIVFYEYTGNDGLLAVPLPSGTTYLDVYDTVGLGTRVVSNNTWFIWCIGYDNLTNSTANPHRINGIARTTSGGSGSSIISSSSGTGSLYLNSVNGTGSYDSDYFAEIIHYNTTLTTAQCQTIEGYLARKWGLTISNQFLLTHPFNRIPPASVVFSPLSISGLSLWLDGADQSSMTLSGSSVTQWRDKSGNGYGMTNNQGTTSISTASLNSLNTVYTPSGTNSKITNFVGRTKCTMFLVGKAAISRYLLAINGGFLYTGNDSLLYFQPPTGTYLDLVDSVSGVVVSNNTWFILCIGYDNATNNTANPYTINGTTRTTTITPRGTPGILTDQNITSTLYINSANGTNSYDSVYTAEILYYNNTLTTTQRQQVEGYLAQKWGLTGLLPSTHPFKKIPA